MGSHDEELAAIAAMVREHLAWEEQMGGAVVPHVDLATLAAPAMPEPAMPEPAMPAPAMPEPAIAEPARPAPAPARSAPTAAGTGVPTSAPAAATGAPASAPGERHRALEILAAEAASCTRCRLHESRTHSVFARGTPAGGIAFVGEGPGYNEDQQGSPFVGPAGQLLDRMIAAMGFERDEVYVCNVVKCRPPENRTPLPDEAGACETFLTRQLELVAPKVIVALGRCAAENLGCAEPGRSWRGSWGSWRGIPVMPTYHPAFLLRSPEMKRPVWEDLQKVLQRLGRPLPAPGSRKA